MKIGIYDPYLDHDSLGGGERYMLTLAKCLADKHIVELFLDDKTILASAEERFAIDLSKVKATTNIFSPKVSFYQKLIATKSYDRLVLLSDGSIPVSLAKKTILHFQHPMEQVNGTSYLNRLKFKRINKVISNSQYTKKYIDKTYAVDSLVLYPSSA